MPIVLILGYVIVLALSVGISGYFSYYGLLRTADEMTLPLVVFLMTIIFVMDATISYFRSVEKSFRLPLLIWAIAAFFSIASNFNFLYSNFMRDDVTQSTITEQLEVFRDDLVTTRAALDGLETSQFAASLRTDLEVELDNLWTQINDPLRPGCGAECRSHLSEIERILGRAVTNLAIPSIGQPPEVVNDWYNRYRAAAENVFQTSLEATQYPAVRNLVNQIDAELLEYDSAERILATKGGLDALPDMAAISDDIERQANALLPEGERISHTQIDPTLGRLGEIVYAFQNGFGEMPNPMATAVSLVLASVVDVLPLLFAFALFGKGRLEKPTKTRADRGRGGRRIIASQ